MDQSVESSFLDHRSSENSVIFPVEQNEFVTFSSPNVSASSNDDDENDDWKSVGEQENDESMNWAKFDQIQESTSSIDVQDEWADFHQSPTASNSVLDSDDEQIQTLISNCFPFEENSCLSDHYGELPSFATFDEPMKNLDCFLPSLSLWKVLANVSNDPIGIQYQWRRSKIENLLHRALDVHQRLPKSDVETDPGLTVDSMVTTNSSNDFDDDQSLDLKENHAENLFTDPESASSSSFPSRKSDFYVLNFDAVSKRELSKTEENLNERSRSATIKTLDLFPGSSTIRNEEKKSSVELLTPVTFMNPKALMTVEDIRTLALKDSIVSPF